MATAANPAAARGAAAKAAAEAVVVADTPVAPARGKKKLLLIVITVLVVVLLAGAATAYIVIQKRAAAQAASLDLYGDPAAAAETRKPVDATPPTFLPLEPFVVNLADKDSDRFAQIGITLEVHDAAVAEKLRAYMPAIRNGILLVLAQKGSPELLSAEGKRALATEIMREASRPFDAGAPPADAPPVRAVHFSSFIIQ